MNSPLSKPAAKLLDDLLTLSSFSCDYMEDYQSFDRRKAVWLAIADAPENAFRELQMLATPEPEMTTKEHAEYTNNRTNQIRNDGL